MYQLLGLIFSLQTYYTLYTIIYSDFTAAILDFQFHTKMLKVLNLAPIEFEISNKN